MPCQRDNVNETISLRGARKNIAHTHTFARAHFIFRNFLPILTRYGMPLLNSFFSRYDFSNFFFVKIFQSIADLLLLV